MAKPHELPPNDDLTANAIVHIEQEDGNSRRATLAEILAIAHAVAMGDVTGLVAALAAKLDDTQADAGGLAVLSAPDAAGVRAAADVYSTTEVDSAISAALVGLLDLKGTTDCSSNPNYPAAAKGDAYVVTVAGKIGGASGTTVGVGDVYFATADNAGGTQVAVGASWDVVLHSAALTGALLAANDLSDVVNPATALANLGGAPREMTVDVVAGTTYTFQTTDSYHHKRFTNASAITATVPRNATQAIAVGARIRITAVGAGQITLVPEDGTVTLNSRGGALKSAGQYAVMEIEKVAANEWDCLGDLST